MRNFLIAGFILLVLAVVAVVGFKLIFTERGGSLPGLDTSGRSAAAVPQHLQALQNGDAAARKAAAFALWQIGPYAQDAAPALLAVASDPDPEVREAVVKALGRTAQGNQEAVRRLVEALKDEKGDVRAAAATALFELWVAEKSSSLPAASRQGKTGNPAATAKPFSPEAEQGVRAAVPVLRKTLKDTDARARAQAASALGEAGALAEPAVPELIEMLRKDPEERARLEATLALGNTGPAAKAAVPALVDILRNEKMLSIRVNAAGSLGQIHCDPDLVVPALVEAHLKDAEPEVRQWSMISLLQFGPEALKRSQAAVQSLARDPENKKLPDFEKRLASFTAALERRLKNPGTSPPAKEPSSGPRGPAPRRNSPAKAPGG